MSPLILAYLTLFSALASGILGLGADRFPRLLRYGSSILLGLCGLLAILAGTWAMIDEAPSVDWLALGLPWLKWHLRLDSLSGFFFGIVGLLVFAVSLYIPGYLREFTHRGHKQLLWPLGLFTGLFVLSMFLVLLADDAFVFMVSWEMMSVSSYFLVAYQHQHAANQRAAFLYLLMAHVGALAILLGFGVLAGFGGGYTFEAMRAANLSTTWASIAFALAFFGFGIKAGIVPLHAWLPEAHPVAPSHISALMSGVMIKIGIYGIVRLTYDLIGHIQWQWGVVVLLAGSASALLGVLYALMQHDLKRLLAYHSIENIGIILMGLGLSMIFLGTGHPVLGTLGLVAALYHTLNHAVFKGLLFLGAGAVLYRTHERDLDRLGGLIHRMPWTAGFFLVGCIAISALPPFNGFVSEWLTFQTALQAPQLENGILRALIPVTAALLALAAALAAACFVKAYGVAFLGRPRSRHVAHAREVSAGMLAAMGLLAGLCLLLGVLPTTVIEALGPVTQLLVGQTLPSATARGWLWLTPVAPEVASYSAPFVVLGIALVFGFGYFFWKRRAKPARRGYAWDCGFGPLNARMQYTSSAFSQPIRRVFAPAWKIEEPIEVRREAGPLGRATGLRYQLHVHDWSWLKGYLPIGRLVLGAARRIGHIQTGSIRTYLLYSFVTLLVFLWIIS